MGLKCKDLRRVWGKKAAPKVPEWPGYGNFRKVTPNPHFLKSTKGEPREIFLKSPKKYPLLERPNSVVKKVALSSNLHALIVQRLENILA